MEQQQHALLQQAVVGGARLVTSKQVGTRLVHGSKVMHCVDLYVVACFSTAVSWLVSTGWLCPGGPVENLAAHLVVCRVLRGGSSAVVLGVSYSVCYQGVLL